MFGPLFGALRRAFGKPQADPPPSDWLLQYRRNVTSQLGEDGILEMVFEVIPRGDRWCVEFGAADGVTFSNTHSLISSRGWSSVQIEGAPVNFALLERTYAGNPKVLCLNRMVGFEGENALENLLRGTPVPVDFDLLSIDVDGTDYHIWHALQAYRPKVVLVEFNPTIPHFVSYVQPRDNAVSHGSSLLALQELGKRKGYELVASTEWNGIFVDAKYFPLFDIRDNSIWQMNRNSQYWTHVFQLYDGGIVVGGRDKAMWSDDKLDFEAIRRHIETKGAGRR